jgi:hypothetical protein
MTDVDMASPFVTSFIANSSLCDAQHHRPEYHAHGATGAKGLSSSWCHYIIRQHEELIRTR